MAITTGGAKPFGAAGGGRDARSSRTLASSSWQDRRPPPRSSHPAPPAHLPPQVNVPKTKKAFCKGKECRKHTTHKVTQYKTGKASLYAQGELPAAAVAAGGSASCPARAEARGCARDR
jgi:hypothetical protein